MIENHTFYNKESVLEDHEEICELERILLSELLYHFDILQEYPEYHRINKDIFVSSESKRVYQAINQSIQEHQTCNSILVIEFLKKACASNKEFKKIMKYFNTLSEDINLLSVRKCIPILEIYKAKQELNDLYQSINKPMDEQSFQKYAGDWIERFEGIFQKNLTMDYVNAEMAMEEFKKKILDSREKPKSSDFFRTGYKEVDNQIRYLSGGQLVVIASRPGIGKTTFALNIVHNNFFSTNSNSNNSYIGMFSLETPRHLLISKLVALESSVSLQAIQQLLDGDNSSIAANDLDLIERSKNNVSKMKFLIKDDSDVTIGTIMNVITRWCKEFNLKLVIIDYLQLIGVGEDIFAKRNISQHERIGLISRKLKVLAMKLNICILTLAQLNRKIEERAGMGMDKTPLLSDLRESGSIEQDADVVMLMYEDQENNSNNSDDFPRKKNTSIPKTMMKIAKNRNGPVGTVEFNFDKSYGVYKSSKILDN